MENIGSSFLGFATFTVDDFVKLKSIGNINRYSKREMIVFPESSFRFIYMIYKGKVKIFRLSKRGKEKIIRLLKPYDIFGEYALLGNNNGRESVEALEDCELLLIPRVEFLNYLEEDKEFAQKFTQMLLHRNIELENHLTDIVFSDVEIRALRMLVELASKYGRESGKGIIIDVAITQYEFGNMIGATRETTSTVLNKLKQEGIIEFYRRRIIITDMQIISKRLKKEDGAAEKAKKAQEKSPAS